MSGSGRPDAGFAAGARAAGRAAALLLAACAAPPEAVSFPTDDGGLVHGALSGAGDPAVVLVPGGRFTKESWADEVPPLVRAGFTVLAIDLRGRGASRGPGPQAADDVHLDVLAAARHLRAAGHAPVCVVGASLGGWAAARADVEAPGAIDRLVLLAAPGVERPERLSARTLFVVARDDARGGGVRRLPAIREQYARARADKALVVLAGDAHAQLLFDTGQGPRLMDAILGFLTAP